jgi:UDP-3-O-[3-hydroxymyristoyl] glucosamine N-acyltransferase
MSKQITLGELAGVFQLEVDGNHALVLQGLAPLDIALENQISFLVNPIYRQQAVVSQAGVLILNAADCAFIKESSKTQRAYLVSTNPYALFARIAQYFETLNRRESIASVDPSAQIHPSAIIPSSCTIGPFCSVGEGAILGEKVHLVSHVRLGRDVQVGANTTIHPMTVVYDFCQIGQRCIVHGGVVIGSDGFGFAPDFSETSAQWVKIPQTGRVIIGNDVECGASMTIDRGAMADTVIGDGCKFDNQVQIGHNAKIGAHTVMAGCSGVAGSTELGSLCVIGGYSNFSGHLKIADRTTVSGGTSITKSIKEPGGHYTSLFPFTQHGQWEKNAAIIRGIDKLRQQIKDITKLIK